jgi:hypothetical protein
LVWDNEELDVLNRSWKPISTSIHVKDLDYRLQIVENNLTTFTDVFLNVLARNWNG